MDKASRAAHGAEGGAVGAGAPHAERPAEAAPPPLPRPRPGSGQGRPGVLCGQAPRGGSRRGVSLSVKDTPGVFQWNFTDNPQSPKGNKQGKHEDYKTVNL